jgi:hypothetical protein
MKCVLQRVVRHLRGLHHTVQQATGWFVMGASIPTRQWLQSWLQSLFQPRCPVLCCAMV